MDYASAEGTDRDVPSAPAGMVQRDLDADSADQYLLNDIGVALRLVSEMRGLAAALER